MKKNFISGLFFIILLNLLVKPFYIFIIDPAVQNAVGAAAYGSYFALFGFSWILNIVLDFGTTNFNNREIAKHPHLIRKLFNNILGIRILLGILYFIVAMLLAFVVGYNKQQIFILSILVFNQFLASFNLYLRSNINGLHLFKTDSLLSILDRFLLICLTAFLLWGGVFEKDMRIEWYVYAQSMSYGVTFLIALSIVIVHTKQFKPRINLSYMRLILKSSFPFALLALFMSSYKYFDAFALERLLKGDGDLFAGIYAQSFRLLDGVSQFAFLFATLLLPTFSKLIQEKHEVKSLTKNISLLLLVPAFALSVHTAYHSHEIIELFYHEDQYGSSLVLKLLMVSFIAVAGSYIYGTLLTAAGKLKSLNIIAVVAVCVNIALNLILIPKYKAVGAAIANLTTQWLVIVAQIAVAYNYFKFNLVDVKMTLKMLVFVASSVLLGYISLKVQMTWHWEFLIGFFLSLFLGMLLQLFSLKVIKGLLKY